MRFRKTLLSLLAGVVFSLNSCCNCDNEYENGVIFGIQRSKEGCSQYIEECKKNEKQQSEKIEALSSMVGEEKRSNLMCARALRVTSEELRTFYLRQYNRSGDPHYYEEVKRLDKHLKELDKAIGLYEKELEVMGLKIED